MSWLFVPQRTNVLHLNPAWKPIFGTYCDLQIYTSDWLTALREKEKKCTLFQHFKFYLSVELVNQWFISWHYSFFIIVISVAWHSNNQWLNLTSSIRHNFYQNDYHLKWKKVNNYLELCDVNIMKMLAISYHSLDYSYHFKQCKGTL